MCVAKGLRNRRRPSSVSSCRAPDLPGSDLSHLDSPYYVCISPFCLVAQSSNDTGRIESKCRI